LNALRAFEAAARHGSFSAAANELSVTPGAIAQHVKTLEEWSGSKLFDRHPQGVSLTAAGSKVLPQFVTAFDRLGESIQSLRSHSTPDEIRIAALPSIAQLWLSPRLPEIRSRHRNLKLSVWALEYPPNLKREPFDLSLFFEPLPGDPTRIEIFRDTLFPVCSPQVARELGSPQDLTEVTCLHDSRWTSDWKLWLDKSCPGLEIDTAGPTFSLYSLALEEAINGAGVLIGHESLVRRHLEQGLLVAPFESRIESNSRLALETPQSVDSTHPLAMVIAELTGRETAGPV
jgi:DNA-binding transcriptional LysR family regulator